MAKYTVKFSCGHTCVIDLYGPEKDRKRKIEYYERLGICQDCYRAEREAEKAEGCVEVEMLYREYKSDYADYNTKSDSYDQVKKTIIVYIPAETTSLETEESEMNTEYTEKREMPDYVPDLAAELQADLDDSAPFALNTPTSNEMTDIIAKHAAWLLGDDNGQRADLRNSVLNNMSLPGADLRRADLSNANMVEVNLLDSNLLDANLYTANLYRANLSGINLSGADLRGVYLKWANLHGANLVYANLSGADLSGADLRGADLRGANLSDAKLDGAALDGACRYDEDGNPLFYETNGWKR